MDHTAGKVLCRPGPCHNFGCRDIKDSLFYKDPTYQHKERTPKHVSTKYTLFSDIVSTDFGTKASHMRDTDGEKILVIIRELLEGRLADLPQLFPPGCHKLTTDEITACMSHTTMGENVRLWYDGGWLQHQVRDGWQSFTHTEPAMLAGQDRLLINKDYAPYGRPEQQDDSADAAMQRATSSGSTSTVSDDGPLETPSLGAEFCNFCS